MSRKTDYFRLISCWKTLCVEISDRYYIIRQINRWFPNVTKHGPQGVTTQSIVIIGLSWPSVRLIARWLTSDSSECSMSAAFWWSIKHSARRLRIWQRCSPLRNNSPPASELNLPPSNLPTTFDAFSSSRSTCRYARFPGGIRRGVCSGHYGGARKPRLQYVAV